MQSKLSLSHVITVKLVYKDHHRHQHNAILIHKWSLKAGLITWKVYPRGCVQCVQCGLYKLNVVLMYRWSLKQV